jgi:hypothetical protein
MTDGLHRHIWTRMGKPLALALSEAGRGWGGKMVGAI